MGTDADESCVPIDCAAVGVRGAHVINHDKIGDICAFDELNSDRRCGGIVSEADMKLTLPGCRRHLERGASDRNAGLVAREQFAARNEANEDQWQG
ncbi:hypothetical protein [Bradyrhizobium sp. SYSU BS000235]|uniref:hypothetical protein n=1 Tax=Bradyrhizobium sp. SYSU BS000235 TaxID=3411332 RepID=UPI003C72D739